MLEPCCKPVTFFKETVAFPEGLSQHRKWSKTSRAVSQFSVSPHIWAEVAFTGVIFPLKPGSVPCQEILRLEGYILTRDFACKILELLARRKSRAPAVVVGESDSAPNVKRSKLIWNLPEFFQWKNYEKLIGKGAVAFLRIYPGVCFWKSVYKILQPLWSGVDQLKEFSLVSDHTNLHVNFVCFWFLGACMKIFLRG